jgi:hypothetical protein
VKELFGVAGIRWAPIVKEEVSGILSGGRRRFFLSAQECVDLYRARRSVTVEPVDESTACLRGGQEALDAFLEDQERRAQLFEKYGATPDWYEEGYACIKERNYFYGTEEWRNRAKVMRYVEQNRCENCHVNNVPLHVHHAFPVMSVYSYNFDLNFADYKLRVLCKTCHDGYHRHAVPAYLSSDYIVVSAEEHAEYLRELHLMDRAYHSNSLCRFCKDQIEERYPNH